MRDANRDARLAEAMRGMEAMVSDALNAVRVLEIVLRAARDQAATEQGRDPGFVTLRLIEDQAEALDYAMIHAGNAARALHSRFRAALDGKGAA